MKKLLQTEVKWSERMSKKKPPQLNRPVTDIIVIFEALWHPQALWSYRMKAIPDLAGSVCNLVVSSAREGTEIDIAHIRI